MTDELPDLLELLSATKNIEFVYIMILFNHYCSVVQHVTKITAQWTGWFLGGERDSRWRVSDSI